MATEEGNALVADCWRDLDPTVEGLKSGMPSSLSMDRAEPLTEPITLTGLSEVTFVFLEVIVFCSCLCVFLVMSTKFMFASVTKAISPSH